MSCCRRRAAMPSHERRRSRITCNGVPVLFVLTILFFVLMVAKNMHNTFNDGLYQEGRGEVLIHHQLKDEDHNDDKDLVALPYHDDRAVRQRKKDKEMADFVAMTKLKQQHDYSHLVVKCVGRW